MKLRRLRGLRASLLGLAPSIDRFRADGANIGEGVYLGTGVDLDASHRHLITIEDGATFGPRVMVLAHDASTKIPLGYTRVARVTIGKQAFVGAGSIILPGVTIGAEAIIGAGSIVTKDIPAGAVATGNPCTVLGSVDEFIERRRDEMANSPVWEAAGNTVASGITPERRSQQNHALRSGVAYLR